MNIADELSIQLYSHARISAISTASSMRWPRLGFRRVETVGGHIADARATRARLDARGLAAPTGHVPLADLRDAAWTGSPTRRRRSASSSCSCRRVPLEERDRPTRTAGGRSAPSSARHGASAGQEGPRARLPQPSLGAEALPDGRTPLELLFEGAGRLAATLQADLAWLVRGGVDRWPGSTGIATG